MSTKVQTAKNMYVRTVSLGGRKSCPCCKAKLDGRPIYNFGEYIRVRWNTIESCCEKCYDGTMGPILRNFKARNGNRPVDVVGYQGTKVESWMKTDY